MNSIRLTLLIISAVFVILFFIRRSWAMIYLRYAALGIAATVVITPFVWLICSAFKDKDVLMQYSFLPPIDKWTSENLNLNNFRMLFGGETSVEGTVYFWQYILNSLFLSGAATTIQLFLCSLGGYALAKYDFKGKKLIMGFMLGSLMVPGMIFLAPVYELICRIGWIDSYLAILVPGAVSVFGIFLFRQAIVGIPTDIIEAGRIDGCSDFRIYWELIMPLVRPMSGAFCLVCFLGSWNSFIAPQIYIHTQSKLTLPVVLNQYIGFYSQQYGVFLAGTLLAIIPPAILFFALQKEFISGLTSGAVKG